MTTATSVVHSNGTHLQEELPVAAHPDVISQLFEQVKQHPKPQTVNEFIRKAQSIQLSLAALEPLLTILEEKKIIPANKKFKSLFLHAVKLENREQANGYLQSQKFDKNQLAKELLARDDFSPLAFELLAASGLSFSEEEATVCHLLKLVELKIDINQITFGGKSFYLAAMHTQNERLIQTTISKNPNFLPGYLTDPVVLDYYVKKLQIAPDAITMELVLEYHRTLGARLSHSIKEIVQMAAKSDNPELLRSLFSQEGISQEAKTQVGISQDAKAQEAKDNPLETCLTENPNCPKVAQFLLTTSRVDPNAPFSDGRLPLVVACQGANARLVELLIEHGADPFSKDKEGKPPLLLLLQHSSNEMKELVKSKAISKAEFFVKLAQFLDTLKAADLSWSRPFLLHLVKSIDKKTFYTPEGMRLFSSLARNSDQQFLQELKKVECDLFTKQPCGCSLFERLIEDKNSEGLGNLVAIGKISPNMEVAKGQPLAFWAVQNRRDFLLRALITRHAQLNIRGLNNKTLLHIACEYKSRNAVMALLHTQAIGVDLLDDMKRPALYYALKDFDAELVNPLLLAGATPFFLGDQLATYTRHVYNNNFHYVVGKSTLWKNFVESRAQNFVTFLQTQQHDPRELAICWFLIPQLPLQSVMQPLEALKLCYKEFPSVSMEYCYQFLFLTLPESFGRTSQLQKVPNFPEELDLNGYLQLFDSIDWNDLQKPEEKDSVRQAFKEQIFAGSEKNPQIALALKHTLSALTKMADAQKRTKLLLRFAYAAFQSPESFAAVLFSLYQKLETKKKNRELLEELFEFLLGEFRSSIAKKHGVDSVAKMQASSNFQLDYNPRTIIPFAETFFTRLLSTGDKLVASWFKANVPDIFTCKEEREFSWQEASCNLLITTPRLRQATLQKVVEKMQIVAKGTKTAQELRHLVRAKHFLANVVFTSAGKVDTQAVIYFLQKRGHLREIEPGIYRDFINFIGKKD